MPEPEPDTEPASLAVSELSVHAEATNLLFRRRPRALLSHYFVAPLPLIVGSAPATWRWNLVFVGILLGYATLSGFAARWYNAQPASESRARRWGRGLYWQLLLLGLLYDLVFIHLAMRGVQNAMDYLLVLSVAFCAGAAVSYQHLRGLAVVFTVSVMVPQAIYYAVTGERGGSLTAFLVLVFVLFMSNACEEVHKDALHRLKLTRDLIREKTKAESIARTDHLTGLLNRRAFMERALQSLASAARHGRPLSCLMVDIDHFKNINDRHGHGAGDAVLVALTDTVRDLVRKEDVAGRIGGEEFALILPDTDRAGAETSAERLRLALAEKVVAYQGENLEVTVSVGVAEASPDGEPLEELLRRADDALYRAKREGRNRTMVASEAPRPQADSPPPQSRRRAGTG